VTAHGVAVRGRPPAPFDRDARGIVDPETFRRHVTLTRYPAGEQLEGLVDRFWAVRWDLPAGLEHLQRVLTHPGANLYAGHTEPPPGGRPGPVVAELEGVLRRLSSRRLAGRGWNVAALTTPGGLGAFVEMPARELTDRVTSLDRPLVDLDAAGLVRRVVRGGDEEERVAVLRDALAIVVERADAARVAAAREVVAVARVAETDRSVRRLEDLAAVAGVAPRTLQRLFGEYAGVPPTWIVRRYRLLEAAEQARHGGPVDWAALAADLGYSDQPHLVREFKAHLGTTPAAYAARQAPPR
jgi:AraC-like DNA-binding protein